MLPFSPTVASPSPAVIASRFVQYQSMFWWFLLIIVFVGLGVAYLYRLSQTSSRRRTKVVGG
ncbi:hypothetical protein EBR57_07960 [bacterium]|nr:hypothetical protein [bacterium]